MKTEIKNVRGETLFACETTASGEGATAEALQAAKKARQPLHEAGLDGVNLFNADASGLRLVGASFVGANLRGTNFRGSDLGAAKFGEAAVSSANFFGADLVAADFRNAYCFGARFASASLLCADFQGAELQRASFRNANLCGANLRGAILDDADFAGADLRGAHGAEGLQDAFRNDIWRLLEESPGGVDEIAESIRAENVDAFVSRFDERDGKPTPADRWFQCVAVWRPPHQGSAVAEIALEWIEEWRQSRNGLVMGIYAGEQPAETETEAT